MRNDSNVSFLGLKETQMAIKALKDFFERDLANTLNLARVSAPLMVRPETGLNDNLNGSEKAVDFNIRNYKIKAEIVHSLAKWKRYALKKYGFDCYEGLYTDMNAIRPDEILDEIHSAYVDQWDWEKIIKKEDRNIFYLKGVVKEIYEVLKRTETYINCLYPNVLKKKLPAEIYFIESQDLEDKYPNLSPKQREYEIAKEHGAVFVIGIGKDLKSGSPHDMRSPDYDDWSLNGDIIVWDPVLGNALELSSMGIRVDQEALEKQLKKAGKEDRLKLEFHKNLMNGNLPYTVGGGIGQSRLCLFFLEKRHIGEIQSSIWDDETVKSCYEKGIQLL
ncbi:aspartate--ammonia ligase [Peptoniphilus sp. GNH]|nr:aspartate--ammonia ligase [Peptoniphilus sp. GNH]